MLNISELKGLSIDVAVLKAKEVSDNLINTLIAKGVLKVDSTMYFKSNNMHNLDMAYRLEEGILLNNCENVDSRDFVIGLKDNGFKTVSFYNSDMYVGDITIHSIEGNEVVYSGEFDILENVLI